MPKQNYGPEKKDLGELAIVDIKRYLAHGIEDKRHERNLTRIFGEGYPTMSKDEMKTYLEKLKARFNEEVLILAFELDEAEFRERNSMRPWERGPKQDPHIRKVVYRGKIDGENITGSKHTLKGPEYDFGSAVYGQFVAAALSGESPHPEQANLDCMTAVLKRGRREDGAFPLPPPLEQHYRTDRKEFFIPWEDAIIL